MRNHYARRKTHVSLNRTDASRKRMSSSNGNDISKASNSSAILIASNGDYIVNGSAAR